MSGWRLSRMFLSRVFWPSMRKALCVLPVFLFPVEALASNKRVNAIPLVLLAITVASVLAWFWVKRTRTFDNVHLKIIGFSIYFWIVMFAEVIVYGLYRALVG